MNNELLSTALKAVIVIALLTAGSYLIYLKVNYYLKRLQIILTKEQSKEVYFLISSIVVILAVMSYLLYFVYSLNLFV